jgi:hypothetical protein
MYSSNIIGLIFYSFDIRRNSASYRIHHLCSAVSTTASGAQIQSVVGVGLLLE